MQRIRPRSQGIFPPLPSPPLTPSLLFLPLLSHTDTPHPTSQLSIIIEFIAGNVPSSIDRLIALYRPDSLVVGTRGQRGMLQSWGAALGGSGVGSVSKCVPYLSPYITTLTVN